MVEGACELIGFCLGVVGLIGASAVTGLPMWRVTAFIQENIIVMETRWEGLWMNCYRQANIRMQCKVYDSLLYLPPELQAARGLMCCSVALSFLGLVASLPGLRSISCFSDQPRIKSLIIVIAGLMEIMAAICVLIPVSWTANTIIRDFYNPLLLDAQRRELGEALYIGWVTAFILCVSGVVFLACRSYQSNNNPRYLSVYTPNRLNTFHFQPLAPTPSSISSISHQPLLLSHPSFSAQQPSPLAYNTPAAPSGGQDTLYTVPVVYPANMMPVQHHPSLHSSHDSGIISKTRNPLRSGTVQSLYSTPPAAEYDGKFGTAVQPTVPSQPIYRHMNAGSQHNSSTHSSSGIYI